MNSSPIAVPSTAQQIRMLKTIKATGNTVSTCWVDHTRSLPAPFKDNNNNTLTSFTNLIFTRYAQQPYV